MPLEREEYDMRLLTLPVAAVLTVGLLTGCVEGRSGIAPNRDRALRLNDKAFAADAKVRVYPATAPHAGIAPMRAEVDYSLKLINLVNLADAQWDNAELWVNGRYVCHLAHIEPRLEKTLNFQILFDATGASFPTSYNIAQVHKVELFHDGSLYTVPLHLAD
jgi:hypothetical protein